MPSQHLYQSASVSLLLDGLETSSKLRALRPSVCTNMLKALSKIALEI